MHPVFFQIGDRFFIGTYGVLIALGLLAGIGLASLRARKRGISPDAFFDLTFVAVISGFVSARILFILLNWQMFKADPGALIFSRTGFVFLGGFVGACVVTIGYIKYKKLPVLAMGDLAVPSLALAHAFGRMGCHFTGCCFGGVCSSEAIGIHLHRHAMPGSGSGPETFFNAFEEQVMQGIIPPTATESLAVWPVQLMESFGLFAIVGLLVWFAAKPRRPGRVLAIYLVTYAVLRYGLEFLRGDPERGYLVPGLVTTSQGISIGMIAAGVWLWNWTKRFPVREFVDPEVIRAAEKAK